jgi:hypothetical protein
MKQKWKFIVQEVNGKWTVYMSGNGAFLPIDSGWYDTREEAEQVRDAFTKAGKREI